MTRSSNKHGLITYKTGQRAKEIRPTKPEPASRKTSKVIDQDALAAAKADLDAHAAEPARITTGNTLPATGHCHSCDRAISGERRFCGPCLARRSR